MSEHNEQNPLAQLDLLNLARENISALHLLLQPEQLDRLVADERTAVLAVLQTTADTAWRLADNARIMAGRVRDQPPAEREHEGTARAEAERMEAEIARLKAAAWRARAEKARWEGQLESLVAEACRIKLGELLAKAGTCVEKGMELQK